MESLEFAEIQDGYSRSMKLCPTCLRCYEDDEISCLSDQTVLVPSRHGTRLIADKYRLDRLLGRGGMGAVYLATHVDLDRLVAIKLLLPDFTADSDALERFRREARAAARLNHPNVADTYDYGVLPDGGSYIVMEMVEGQTLREFMDAAGPLSVTEATEIGKQVADGIDAAHRHDIIHRDLKPSNIILTRDHLGRLQAKVVDFGVAKLKEHTTTSGGLTASGSLIGTPRYMSPEQCAGLHTDARSDIYSMGVILYEMLAGRPPFDAPTATAIAIKHIQTEPPPLSEFRPGLSAELESFVTTALDKDPAKRQQTAAEFARKLGEIADRELQKDVAATSPSEPGKPVDKFLADGRETKLFPEASKTTHRAGQPTTEHSPEFHDKQESSVRGFSAQPAEIITETATKIVETPPARDGAAAATESARPEFIETPDNPVSEFATSSTQTSQRKKKLWPALALAPMLLVIIAVAVWFALTRTNKPESNQSANINTSRETGEQTTQIPTPKARADVRAEATHNQTDIGSDSNTQSINKTLPGDSSQELRTALGEWVAATNARDINKLISFYAPLLTTFYTKHDVSQSAVRVEKGRLLSQIDSADVRTTAPATHFSTDGLSATMRFRKSWNFTGAQAQSGEVVQELSWKKIDSRWKIVGERDVEVIRLTR
jgi:serine/threonine protein kinase/ketosteroid isomerase-like protein